MVFKFKKCYMDNNETNNSQVSGNSFNSGQLNTTPTVDVNPQINNNLTEQPTQPIVTNNTSNNKKGKMGIILIVVIVVVAIIIVFFLLKKSNSSSAGSQSLDDNLTDSNSFFLRIICTIQYRWKTTNRIQFYKCF